MAHFMEQLYADYKDMLTKFGESETVIGAIFEITYRVIVDFDMGTIPGATERRRYTALTGIQIGNYY